MQLSGSVEVEDGAEGFGMSVEKVLVVNERVVVAELAESLVRVAVSESPESCVWQSVQGPPENLVLDAADVDADPAIERRVKLLLDIVQISMKVSTHSG